MAKGFGARLAEGLAEAVSITGQAYGNARMTIALEQRKAYQEKLRDEREAVAKQEERGWREEEAVKEREHDFAKMEKAEEYDAESQERTLSNQLTLAKMRGKGGSFGGGGSSGGITRTITDAEGKVWGVTKTGEKIDLGIKGKAGSSGSGGGKETAAIQNARFEAVAKYGPDATDAQVAEFLPGNAKAADTVKPEALARAMQSEYAERSKMTHPGYKEWRKMDEAQRQKAVGAAVLRTYEGADAALPEGFVSKYGQESQEEAPQSQAIPAPATSTNGEKPTDATPKGSGTETSPYIVETPEQAEWVRKNAKGGAVIRDVAAGRVVRKPKEK